MTVIIAFLIPLFLFLNHGNATGICSSLFGSQTGTFERYDPNNIDDVIKALITDGEYKKIRQADLTKTNLPFFNDYVKDVIKRLEKERIRLVDSSITQEIYSIISDAKLRMKTKKVTYDWVWQFSFQTLLIFEQKYNVPEIKYFQNILNLFPRQLMIPTFAEQDFKSFIETEGYHITFLGMREDEQYVDGNLVFFSPKQFFNHDFLHYKLRMNGDKLLSKNGKNYDAWLKLHSRIKHQIDLLEEPQKKYVQFIYFYLLHEELAIRDRLIYRFLNPKKGKMSEYVSNLLAHDLIQNHFDKLLYPSNFQSELYTRVTRPYDFREVFPNKNPQEVLLEGISGFIKIITKIESDSDSKPRERKRFFPF